jgi:hypothetical protein
MPPLLGAYAEALVVRSESIIKNRRGPGVVVRREAASEGAERGRGVAWRGVAMDGVPMVGAMSPSRWEAATKLTRRLLLPTPESPMRRNLKEHSWPPLLPAPGDPISPFPSDSSQFGGEAARNAGAGRAARGGRAEV